MDKVLNFAVISAATMGQRHMKGIVQNPQCHLYGICDINEDKLKEAAELYHPDKCVTDYMELVNDPAVDCVVVATPDPFHYQQTVDSLRAGKDVLLEKPMSLHYEQCLEMLKVEKETGRHLMIGQVSRCAPAFMQAKKMVDEGKIGELFFVESEYAHNYTKFRGCNDWRLSAERDGFIGGGCHAVDLLRWIAGNPTEVYALANHKCMPDWGAPDMTVALYKFPNNVQGKVFCSIGCKRSYTMRTVLYGTKGTIICSNTAPTIQYFSDSEPLEDGVVNYTKPHNIPVQAEIHNTIEQIKQFVDAILADKPLPVPAYEGACDIAIATATTESARLNKPMLIEYPEM